MIIKIYQKIEANEGTDLELALYSSTNDQSTNSIKFYTWRGGDNIDNYISKSTLEYLIIFRMIPGLPLLLQNIILSLLNISIYKFIIISLIGFSPIIFATVFIGNKIKDIQLIKELTTSDLLTWDFLFFIFLIVFMLFLRIKFKK